MISSLGLRLISIIPFILGLKTARVGAEPMKEISFKAGRVTLHSPEKQPLGEIVASITRQTGIELDVAGFDASVKLQVDWSNLEFWKSLEAIADAVEGRWEITPRRTAPRLVKATNKNAPKAFVNGPFRVAARDVLIRADLETGRTLYDLTLDVAWEPRIPVFRMDEVPHPLQGMDDAKNPLTTRPVKTRNPVEGFTARSTIRLDGLTRASRRIDSLSGTILVTAAEEMLHFDFLDLDKPHDLTKQGVKAALKKFAKDGSYWIADVDLKYPIGGPSFESFETYWLSRNKCVLIDPDGSKKFLPTDREEVGTAIRYRFKEDAGKGLVLGDRKGWRIDYETPGPMREIPIEFELKGINLP